MPQKKHNSNNSKKTQNAYFFSLELENVRCFREKQKIDFSENNLPRQWTIILGDNGTGKSTILQCLAAMIGERGLFFLMGLFIDTTVTDRGENWFSVFNSHTSVRLDFLCPINWSKYFQVESDILFIAYGSSRKAGKTSLSAENNESLFISLFDETVLLVNPEEWLLQADYAARRKSEFQEKRKRELKLVKKILISILPDVDGIKFEENKKWWDWKNRSTPIVEFHTPYGWIESKDLSLGYRTSMAWIVDFASRMFDRFPESENPLAESAVVLIDEIDLHLHPKLQRDLLDYLSNLFPNTQFIVTTHSPLIVQSAAARDANIVVCRREGDHVVIDQSVEAVRNWRADQILTSDLFGLETARPKEIEKDLLERQGILSKAKLTKKDEKRLKELEEKIGSVPVMENPKYDEAMDIILRAAEKLEKQNGNPK